MRTHAIVVVLGSDAAARGDVGRDTGDLTATRPAVNCRFAVAKRPDRPRHTADRRDLVASLPPDAVIGILDLRPRRRGHRHAGATRLNAVAVARHPLLVWQVRLFGFLH